MAQIPRIVCEPCNKEMLPVKNGVIAEAMTERGPYYKAECDRWECQTCGRTVLIGFGDRPFAMHHEAGYDTPAPDVQFTFRD